MKITKNNLKRIIKEELGRVLDEAGFNSEIKNGFFSVRAFTRTNPDDPGDVHYIIRIQKSLSGEKPVGYLVDERTYNIVKAHDSYPSFEPEIIQDIVEPFEIATPQPWYRKVGR